MDHEENPFDDNSRCRGPCRDDQARTAVEQLGGDFISAPQSRLRN